jgi:malonate transporter
VVRTRVGRPPVDAAIDGLNAGYANAGFVGFPLCEAVFGRESLPLATIAAVLTVCVLFAVALILVETGLQTGGMSHRCVLRAACGLGKNPLLIAPVAGVAWSTSGLLVSVPVETFLHMMAGSATPCALMALGLFVSVRRDNAKMSWVPMAFTALKLIGQPVLTAIVAIGFLRLPHPVAGIAIVMAALPTGTGPFMLAEYYDRGAVVTAQTILLSTATSIVTLTILIYLIR